MDPITRQAIAAASASGGDRVYVDDVFSTFLYNGTGSTRSIDNGIDLSGEGGLTWIKCRTVSDLHYLYDTERGATKSLHSDDTYAESTRSQTLTSFNSDGFSLGTDGDTNLNGRKYVSWSFRKAPGFFDVVTWSGDNTTGRQISHSLGSTPGMIIIKCTTSGSTNWWVWHRSAGQYEGKLNATSSFGWETITSASATTFTITYGNVETNQSGNNYVAYVFAHDDQSFGTNSDEAIIKCGSYTGNGSSSGPVINLGFEPQWLLIKRTSNTDPWILFDNMRGMVVGGQDARLEPSEPDAEDVFGGVDVSPTGFQLASSTGFQNSNGDTYIYMAIRRPHKPAEAATDVFAIDTGSASSNIPTWDSTFAVDMAFAFNINNGQPRINSARMLGSNYVITTSTNTLASDGSLPWDSNLGWGKDYNSSWYSYMFKRAPGFFDMVAFKGNGSSSQAITHNLGVAPEFILLKNTGNYYHWRSYDAASGPTKYMLPSGSNGNYTGANVWNDTTPTATQFTVGSHQSVNQSGYLIIAYLFASQSGISKIGSYSGTGYAINVDCGFTSGARFILIKRSDSSGSWYIFDTLRGISSGNDPYYFLDTYAAQITNTDYIDPLNAGFTVTSSAPAGLNTSGGTYIFLAIA